MLGAIFKNSPYAGQDGYAPSLTYPNSQRGKTSSIASRRLGQRAALGVVRASVSDHASESQKAAKQLERAMRPVPRLAPLHGSYRELTERYYKSESHFYAPASPRKAFEAAADAMRHLFAMKRIADHLFREFSPVLSERRLDAEQGQQAQVARAAANASGIHDGRMLLLELEHTYLMPTSHASRKPGIQAETLSPPSPALSPNAAKQPPTWQAMPVRATYPASLWQRPNQA